MKRAQDNISAILMRRFMEKNGPNGGGNNQQLPSSSTNTAQNSSHFGGANVIAHNSQASTSQFGSANNLHSAQAFSTTRSVDSGISQNSGSFAPSSSTQTTPSFHASENVNIPSTSQAVPYFLQNTDSELAAPEEYYSTNFQEFPLLNGSIHLNSSNTTNNIVPNPTPSAPIPKGNEHRKPVGWRKNPEVLKLVMAYIKWAENNPNSHSLGGLKVLVKRIEALLNVENFYRPVKGLVYKVRQQQKLDMIGRMQSASNDRNTVHPIIAMNMNPIADLTNSLNSQNCGQQTRIQPIPNMNVSTNTNLQYSGQQFQFPQNTTTNSTANLLLYTTMSTNVQNCQQQQMQSNARIAMNSEQLNNLVRNRNTEKSKQIGPLITIESDSESEASTSQATINTFSPDGMARDCNPAQLEQTISQQMNVFVQQKNVFDGQERVVEQFLSSNFEQAETASPQGTW